MPPRRQSMNVVEFKHSVIRSIYLLIINASPDMSRTLALQQGLRISNDLYGNSVTSSFEMARGFSRPVTGKTHPLPNDVYEGRMILLSKRKLTKFLQSMSNTDTVVSTGNMVEIYVHGGTSKRGKWTSIRTVLSFHTKSWTVTVPKLQ